MKNKITSAEYQQLSIADKDKYARFSSSEEVNYILTDLSESNAPEREILTSDKNGMVNGLRVFDDKDRILKNWSGTANKGFCMYDDNDGYEEWNVTQTPDRDKANGYRVRDCYIATSYQHPKPAIKDTPAIDEAVKQEIFEHWYAASDSCNSITVYKKSMDDCVDDEKVCEIISDFEYSTSEQWAYLRRIEKLPMLERFYNRFDESSQQKSIKGDGWVINVEELAENICKELYI